MSARAKSPQSQSIFDRDAALERLANDHFDLLVVGGGITGAGIALDAAARGLSTALVERNDFASGTSSRSSKLVHGGLRYLQQREYRLVYENLAERHRLLRNAPHLVEPLPFLIPIFGRGSDERSREEPARTVASRALVRAYSTALWLYDLTGGLRIGKRHRRVSTEEAVRLVPALRPDRIVAGFVYYDAHADDARLTLTIARTAVLAHGAVAANYTAVESLSKDAHGRVAGAVVSGGLEVSARAVINATGVFADRVRALDEPGAQLLRPAKGVHVTLSRARVPTDVAVVLPVPKDRRSIFVVPWGDRVYVGTTDTDYHGDIDNPVCTDEDVAYLLGALNLFVIDPVEATDVIGAWAGLRPLLEGAGTERSADLSRRHAVTTSRSGLVTVTGGKLTTYRQMAEDAVDAAGKVLGQRLGRSPTRKLPLWGAPRPGEGADNAHLAGRYGKEASTVLAIIEGDADLARPLVEGLPYLRAEAVFGVRYEMARTVDDILSRRTRATLLDGAAAAAAAPEVARLIGPELGWSQAEVERAASDFTNAQAVVGSGG